MSDRIIVPRYYKPRPYQQEAWKRRMSNRYNFYFKLWPRQVGKDTDDIEFCLFDAWKTPGTQTAYVGLDNKWVGTNIFNKYIDGRRFWEDFPREHINVRDTQKEVTFSNHPDDMAEARVKFIGFQNDQAMIGSSYDRFYISEASLYGQNAFQFIEPIWENKLATGENLRVYINGTPRGMQNVYTQMLQNYTGEKDPEAFKGEHIIGHYSTYVDRLTVEDIYIPDGEGGWRRLYDDGWIEVMKQRYLDAYGNLNLFLQEFYCDFTTVNSGLVYQGVEQMEKQGRITDFNLDTSKPVYVAFDISSKDKITDATVGLVYQYIGNKTLVYDMIELRGMALVQVVAQLATKGYWPYIRVGFLPWDSDRSASSETPLEEVDRMYPNVTWHALEKERIDRGIMVVREAMPNMWIHRDNCRRLVESLHAYEYKRLEKQDDWSAVPYHNWASHCLDGDTVICTAAGDRKVKDLEGKYGFALTDHGYRPFYGVRRTRLERNWVVATLSNGLTIRMTEDHIVPTSNGLCLAGDLEIGDTLRYAPYYEREEHDGTAKPNARWKALCAGLRRTLSDVQRQAITPRSMEEAFRRDTERLRDPSHQWRPLRQPHRESPMPLCFRTYEDPYAGSKVKRENTKRQQETMAGAGYSEAQMGQNSRGKEVVSRALERIHREDEAHREAVCGVWQDVPGQERGTWEVLLAELQDEGASAQVEGITREHSDDASWAYAIEVYGGFLYTDGILTHNCCDALRYACMGIEEMEYLGLPMDGSRRKMPSNYEYFGDIGNERPSIPITMMTEKQRREWMKHGRFDTGDGDKSGRYGFGGF